ncbi:MAG: hypothetical protein K2M97_01495 [Muribaculaceae bacterium]|nr:hypothetical protein [Muribaculaceae bacterium]
MKLAPHYSGGVIHTADAASLPRMVGRVMADKATALAEVSADQERMRRDYEASSSTRCKLSPEEARRLGMGVSTPATKLTLAPGIHDFHLSASDVAGLINWRAFFGEWRMDPSGSTPEARELRSDAEALIASLGSSTVVTARAVVCDACRCSDDDAISLNGGALILPTPRALTPNPATGRCPALCDFVAEAYDTVTLFAVTADLGVKGTTDYDDMLRQTVAHRLAEAATEWLHRHVCDGVGIRPAVGYPSLPDQRLIFSLDRLLRYPEIGITLTDTGAMNPSASTSGIIIAHPEARYFSVY